MSDLLLGIVALTSLLLIGNILRRYNRSEHAQAWGVVNELQLRVTLLASKTGILDQYVEEIWHQCPEGVFEKLLKLREIRDASTNAVNEILSFINDRNFDQAQIVIAQWVDDNEWERRARHLVLTLCKDLTLDATLAKKPHGEERQYKRKPTLISLREIADLLREERSGTRVQNTLR